MRYSGEEGRATVNNVNFLSAQGFFLGYQDLMTTRMPENEFYAMGMEVLSLCKPDWADDWGGRGEITWDIGKGLQVDHRDRRVEQEVHTFEIPERDLRVTIEQADIPGTEIFGISLIQCKAVYDGPDETIFGRYHAEDREGIDRVLSSKLTSSLEKIFSATSSICNQSAQTGYPTEAKFSWVPGDKVTIEQIHELEKFDPMIFLRSEEELSGLLIA
ncbi:hypothetical protein [Sulfitobacter sp. R18_1]|uniref:hypothetical protein n=1 Tax=Sulfitobacter sp. R18_1 TaxID=2821104 RepID=UPI001ADC71E3|nr:hypothetical protein [Sulfitobacter sp. R18_1]MBO9428583.1 hypothetical protein [Sulfitobacter sp. R18_1]